MIPCVTTLEERNSAKALSGKEQNPLSSLAQFGPLSRFTLIRPELAIIE